MPECYSSQGAYMNWVITVSNMSGSFRYWVEAADKDEAMARGYRLHCASENFKGGADRVAEAKQVQ
jgi:hypothetical protein